jgi:hypothetical protein
MVNFIVRANLVPMHIHPDSDTGTRFKVKDPCAGESGVVAVELGAHQDCVTEGVVVGFWLTAFVGFEGVRFGFAEFFHLFGGESQHFLHGAALCVSNAKKSKSNGDKWGIGRCIGQRGGVYKPLKNRFVCIVHFVGVEAVNSIAFVSEEDSRGRSCHCGITFKLGRELSA